MTSLMKSTVRTGVAEKRTTNGAEMASRDDQAKLPPPTSSTTPSVVALSDVERHDLLRKGKMTEDNAVQLLAKAESMNVAADAFAAQQTKADTREDKLASRNWRIAIYMSIISFISFIVANIFARRFQYPVLFEWYDKMISQKEKGDAKYPPGGYSMYQVCTTMEFAPVGYFMNALTVWKSLDRSGALFLAQCVAEFNNRGMPITALHWNGSARQTNAKKLYANPTEDTGWASGGCSGTYTLAQREQTLINNWGASKNEGNIWYKHFPDPMVERHVFLTVPVVSELIAGSRKDGGAVQNSCNAQSFVFSDMYRLFDGGLCRIAFEHTNETVSSSDLFANFFVGSPNIPVDCSGAAFQGAMSGATGAGSGLLACAALGADSPAFLVGVVGMTVAGGILGGISGRDAAKDACKQKARSENLG
jgi:hypothetical protein